MTICIITIIENECPEDDSENEENKADSALTLPTVLHRSDTSTKDYNIKSSSSRKAEIHIAKAIKKEETLSSPTNKQHHRKLTVSKKTYIKLVDEATQTDHIKQKSTSSNGFSRYIKLAQIHRKLRKNNATISNYTQNIQLNLYVRKLAIANRSLAKKPGINDCSYITYRPQSANDILYV